MRSHLYLSCFWHECNTHLSSWNIKSVDRVVGYRCAKHIIRYIIICFAHRYPTTQARFYVFHHGYHVALLHSVSSLFCACLRFNRDLTQWYRHRHSVPRIASQYTEIVYLWEYSPSLATLDSLMHLALRQYILLWYCSMTVSRWTADNAMPYIEVRISGIERYEFKAKHCTLNLHCSGIGTSLRSNANLCH